MNRAPDVPRLALGPADAFLQMRGGVKAVAFFPPYRPGGDNTDQGGSGTTGEGGGDGLE